MKQRSGPAPPWTGRRGEGNTVLAAGGAFDPPPRQVIKQEPRTLVWRTVDSQGRAVVAKLYRHRGWISALRSRLSRFRVEREFLRLEHLARSGLPVTVPLEWSHGWNAGDGFHELLVMEEVAGAVSLDTLPASLLQDSDAGGLQSGLELAPLFQMVRRMHECGLCHQTLYAANVLLSRPLLEAGESNPFVLCDVPRSWVFPGRLSGTRLALWDLLDLDYTLRKAGHPPGPAALAAYGLEECSLADREWFQSWRGKDPRGKRTRLRRDVRARLSWGLAWYRAGLGMRSS